ncbi:MAG TPA: radical SAM protein [Terriglobales bacterium]|jgi:radical SAM protein with 4Fe4S-binding SPASM domain|nr:radical SAM protein [Terriglobales bacterium]
MSLIEQLNAKALALGVPISVHLDLTYRCNERCEHCYLEHDDKGEMTAAEIFDILSQLADAGVFFLVISGGEPLLRRDFFQILERARSLLFNVKLKTNAVLIRENEARRLRELGVEQVQISVYSHRPEVHDGITKLPGSLKKTLRAIEFLKSQGLKVTIANVLMRQNLLDVSETQRLASEMGVGYTLDPTVTPMMSGDTAILDMRAPRAALREAFRDPVLVGNVEEFCAVPAAIDADALDALPCSAGHTACYISPYADVYPCVQFPLPSGNLRRQKFIDIWKNSSELNEVRSITARNLPTCSSCTHVASCTRCPGLAFMEGNMRGPSTADCEKSLVRTGIPSANMLAKTAGRWQPSSLPGLVQIRLAAT